MRLATFYDHIKVISQQERVPFLEALQRAKFWGITSLEVTQHNLVGREDEVGHELSYTEMQISSIPAWFDFGRDSDIKKQAEPVLEAARYLGAKRILAIPGFFAEQDSPEERQRQKQAMLDATARLAEMASGYGVALVMEDFDSPLAPYSTAAGLLEFLDGCPGVSCCFDTGNFRFMAEDERDAYSKLKGKITHVHLKDRALTPDWGAAPLTAVDGQELYPAPVGSGVIKIAEILGELARDGYDGICTIEHFGAENMGEALEESARWLQENFPFE